uniref:Uncharacterized protein n=1 Tax=Pelusios castaneus TaxID=367368 RepID=A0A8C8RZK9_9SAUR
MGCLGNSKTEDQRNEEKAQREANKKIEKQLQKDNGAVRRRRTHPARLPRGCSAGRGRGRGRPTEERARRGPAGG